MLNKFVRLGLCAVALFASGGALCADSVQVINDGVASLEKRLEMIDRAQTKIDVEYFIYTPDEAGRLFTQALVQKKQQNPQIRIRILLDAAPFILKFTPEYVTALHQQGIEVRYYNPAPLFEVEKWQYRDHRKILLIDNSEGELEGITGGRNIADQYFSMSPKFNFLDRDIWAQGSPTNSAVAQMEDSFEKYWVDRRTQKVQLLHKPEPPQNQSRNADELYRGELLAFQEKSKLGEEFLKPNQHDREVLQEIARIGRSELADPRSTGECGKLQFVTDDAGFTEGRNASSDRRHVLKFIMDQVNETPAESSLLFESAYFIVEDAAPLALFQQLKDKKIRTTLLTNGLVSTDAFYVAANFIPQARSYEYLSSASLYLYSGKAISKDIQIKDAESQIAGNVIWGIHAKTYVFSDRGFAIGTFNMDPRSANLNAEMLLYCEQSPGLTNYVSDNIQLRIGQSAKINKNGTKANNKDILQGATLLEKLEFYLSLAPSRIFAFLL
jgi:putative cardiolipin synthase